MLLRINDRSWTAVPDAPNQPALSSSTGVAKRYHACCGYQQKNGNVICARKGTLHETEGAPSCPTEPGMCKDWNHEVIFTHRVSKRRGNVAYNRTVRVF